MKIENKEFEIEYKGQKYSLQEPNVVAVEKMQNFIKEHGEEKSLQASLNMLDDCGLPIEVARTLSVSNIEKIVTTLVGAKN